MTGLPARARARIAVTVGLTAAVTTATLGLTGCRGDAGAGELAGYRLAISTAPTPPIVGPNLVVMTLTDPDGAPVHGAEIRLEGTMAHAGMVPVFEDAREDDGSAGRYRIDAFFFTMGGDWILRAHMTLADGGSGVIEREIRVVR